MNKYLFFFITDIGIKTNFLKETVLFSHQLMTPPKQNKKRERERKEKKTATTVENLPTFSTNGKRCWVQVSQTPLM